MIRLLIAITFLAYVNVMYAQQPLKSTEPESKVELALLSKGALIKKEFIPLGYLQAKYNKAEVEIIKIEDLVKGTKTYGVVVKFEYSTTYSTDTKSAYIDQDEIDELMNVLKKMNEITSNNTPTNYTEVIYACRSGYELGAFYSKSKLWTFYMKLEKYDKNSFISLEKDAILTFQLLLEKAKEGFK